MLLIACDSSESNDLLDKSKSNLLSWNLTLLWFFSFFFSSQDLVTLASPFWSVLIPVKASAIPVSLSSLIALEVITLRVVGAVLPVILSVVLPARIRDMRITSIFPPLLAFLVTAFAFLVPTVLARRLSLLPLLWRGQYDFLKDLHSVPR